jgi:hypothetical protein
VSLILMLCTLVSGAFAILPFVVFSHPRPLLVVSAMFNAALFGFNLRGLLEQALTTSKPIAGRAPSHGAKFGE